MRDGASSEVLAGAAGWVPSAASWLDSTILAESIPIVSGKVTGSRSEQVLETVTFTVPEWADERSWVPDTPQHPLARFGQQIDLAIDVTGPRSTIATRTRLGRFLITDWDHDEVARTVEVTARGILHVVAEDAFTTPEVPRSAGTFESEFRRLMSPGIPVSVDAGLTDRAVPLSMQYPDDRLDALNDLAQAWPARITVDQWGQVWVRSPLPDLATPVLWLTDGEGGTLVAAPRGDTRIGAANIVVGSSSKTDAAAQDPITATARITTGPMKATNDGTGYRRVVQRWSSPLTVTAAQLQAAVNTIAANLRRQSVVRSLTVAPDPRIELDDAVSITRAGVEERGYVVSYELPLTVGDGAMRVDVGVLL